MLDTEPLLIDTDFPALQRGKLQILQVNLGYLCNLSCTHCHVNAGPKRTELATEDTVNSILQFVDRHNIQVLDLTGGAPEMNPHFRYLVEEARRRSVEVVDRCNLTILLEPGYEDLADFLADNDVTVTASLPCYTSKNVSEQRGKGVFESSIEALKLLNTRGYGTDKSKQLHLVYNPNGAFLPPAQEALERDYKRVLAEDHGIEFDRLLTITNMPISRFGGTLLKKKQFFDYMNLLKTHYSRENLQHVMCKSLISIDWQGYVYDCDFNQMLGWPMKGDNALVSGDEGTSIITSDHSSKVHIDDLLDRQFEGKDIVVGEHCYGCAAGSGSSCSGALN